jgi:hypothetical protein
MPWCLQAAAREESARTGGRRRRRRQLGRCLAVVAAVRAALLACICIKGNWMAERAGPIAPICCGVARGEEPSTSVHACGGACPAVS